jgi:hypothetical protein
MASRDVGPRHWRTNFDSGSSGMVLDGVECVVVAGAFEAAFVIAAGIDDANLL